MDALIVGWKNSYGFWRFFFGVIYLGRTCFLCGSHHRRTCFGRHLASREDYYSCLRLERKIQPVALK